MPPKSAATPTSKLASQETSSASSNAFLTLWHAYQKQTPARLKLIDSYLVFVMLSGIIQFVYCVLLSNFPFNAFLAGYEPTFLFTFCHAAHSGPRSSFSSCVGQFVLTASLRSQVNPANSEEFKEVSPERYASQLFSAPQRNLLTAKSQSIRRFRARIDSFTFLRVQLPRLTFLSVFKNRRADCSNIIYLFPTCMHRKQRGVSKRAVKHACSQAISPSSEIT